MQKANLRTTIVSAVNRPLFMLREKCGIFGAYGLDFDAARLAFFGLYALQHRGQESSGIAVSNGYTIKDHKAMGLVSQVFREEDIQRLAGPLGIGHNRYSTRGASVIQHAQPIVDHEGRLALGHNGNLFDIKRLAQSLDQLALPTDGLNDSELMHLLIWHHVRAGAGLEEAVTEIYPQLIGTGAFSVVAMTKDKLVAFRDPSGIRPLSIGKLNGGHILASETCALDTVGATFIRDVEPGEMVSLGPNGVSSHQLAPANPKIDSFEFVYFARPDSRIDGQLVYTARQKMGRLLALEYRPDVDLVIPVPDSAVPAAQGYSEVTGNPYREALAKNRYIHRSFIQPEPHIRAQTVEMKLNPIPELFSGRRVLVIDDSIVRSTTLSRIVRLLRRAGAREVHVGIHSPPVAFPDHYGIDIPRKTDLAASRMRIDEICQAIGAESLGYLSLEGLKAAIDPTSRDRCSYHVFDGNYPIPITTNLRELVPA